MRSRIIITSAALLVLCGFFTGAVAQTVETIDGVRHVHNDGKGKWGGDPKVGIELNRILGSIDAVDENDMFYLPTDVALDAEGNMYVLDQGNYRIQKYDKNGKFVRSFGREGQGPGEFKRPTSLSVDAAGNIYVGDEMNTRLQVLGPDGRNKETSPFEEFGVGTLRLLSNGNVLMDRGRGFIMRAGGLQLDMENPEAPPLFVEIDPEGGLQREFGESYQYGDFMLNSMGNRLAFAVDTEDNIYFAFRHRNRIGKLTFDGKPLLYIARELNIEEKIPDTKDNLQVSGSGNRQMVSITRPDMADISFGIAVDSKSRIWVVTADREMREDEVVQMSMSVSMDESGMRSSSTELSGATDVVETDMFKLEVYSPAGELLGAVPLTHFCDGFRIFGDRLFVIDERRGMQVFDYSIVEK